MRLRGAAALTAACLLVIASCGRDDNKSSATTAAAATTTAPTTAATTAGSSGASTPSSGAPSTGAPSSSAAAGGGAGSFGTVKDVCGPGDGKGATDVGVTDTEIHVATISDPGFAQAPGLNRELFDAADAFTKWCNAAGGILGRKLTVDKLDAKITDYKPQID